MLFDSHAHLNDEQFNEDRAEVIEKIKESGVDFVVIPASDIDSSRTAIELAEKYDFIYAAVGIHPHEVEDLGDEALDIVEALAKSSSKVVAIGEIGLDYYYDFSPREEQKKWFRKQIELANRLELPFIVHDREAHKDTFDIIDEYKSDKINCVIHCYSGSAELAKEYIKKGIVISIPGTVTFKNNKKTVEVVKQISLDHMLIETDSPYLAPVPKRGKRNDSSYVRYVAEKIAEIKEISVEEVAQKTKNNALDFFRIKNGR